MPRQEGPGTSLQVPDTASASSSYPNRHQQPHGRGSSHTSHFILVAPLISPHSPHFHFSSLFPVDTVVEAEGFAVVSEPHPVNPEVVDVVASLLEELTELAGFGASQTSHLTLAGLDTRPQVPQFQPAGLGGGAAEPHPLNPDVAEVIGPFEEGLVGFGASQISHLTLAGLDTRPQVPQFHPEGFGAGAAEPHPLNPEVVEVVGSSLDDVAGFGASQMSHLTLDGLDTRPHVSQCHPAGFGAGGAVPHPVNPVVIAVGGADVDVEAVFDVVVVESQPLDPTTGAEGVEDVDVAPPGFGASQISHFTLPALETNPQRSHFHPAVGALVEVADIDPNPVKPFEVAIFPSLFFSSTCSPRNPNFSNPSFARLNVIPPPPSVLDRSGA